MLPFRRHTRQLFLLHRCEFPSHIFWLTEKTANTADLWKSRPLFAPQFHFQVFRFFVQTLKTQRHRK